MFFVCLFVCYFCEVVVWFGVQVWLCHVFVFVLLNAVNASEDRDWIYGIIGLAIGIFLIFIIVALFLFAKTRNQKADNLANLTMADSTKKTRKTMKVAAMTIHRK